MANTKRDTIPRQTSHAGVDRLSLTEYRAGIDRFHVSHPNSDLLQSIRAYNHDTVDSLAKCAPLARKRVLDIGASPHGYALEHALELGAAEYVGVGLDVAQPVEVVGHESLGRLLPMNAEHLAFEDEDFDAVLSMSTFEHVRDVPAVLREINRVLRRRGKALITFEPVWTCSYGHHLHHFGAISQHMPDWAHLLWTKLEMLDQLQSVWPRDGQPSLEEAAHWVFESAALNRIGAGQMREFFRNAELTVEWIVALPDQARDPKRLQLVSETVKTPCADLMTKGFSVLLSK